MTDTPPPPLRRLFPERRDHDLDHLYAGLTLPSAAPDRGCWVALCMVASLDGAATLHGRSGGLGGEADLLALSRLRGANDVSLVGAGTVRDEGYGPLTGSASRRADRRRRGLREAPRLAIVTASGRLDPASAVFAEPAEPPIVVAGPDADPAALERLADRAEVHRLGAGEAPGPAGGATGTTVDPSPGASTDGDPPAPRSVDPVHVTRLLADLGLPRILLEGGPALNAAALAAGLIDEVFLTVAPTVVAGGAARIVQGGAEAPTRLTLATVYEHDGDLLLRYRRPDATHFSEGSDVS